METIRNEERPWLDIRLSEELIEKLWSIVDNSTEHIDTMNETLAGNISKSEYIEDKDNWFYKNVLKQCAEKVYFNEWNNYYNSLPFNESALALYKWSPIAEELKSLDKKIVLNSMILKWDNIKDEFQKLIRF